ncbi:MAG: hypothetical protein IJC56_10685 [Clostridia bacterium]|nr:hypothetical protein [Clostridia bacterium]
MGSTAVMNLMLGWLKGVANWILGLFDLAGTAAFSPLKWLSENWLNTLIVLLIAGIIIDVLVWLLRWRPHWVWFNKKRIVINDDDFFAGEELVDSGLYDPTLFAAPAPAKRRAAPPPRRSREDMRYKGERPVRRSAPVRRERPVNGDDFFNVDRSHSGGEDEVFNVSDLPVSQDELAFRDSQKRR